MLSMLPREIIEVLTPDSEDNIKAQLERPPVAIRRLPLSRVELVHEAHPDRTYAFDTHTIPQRSLAWHLLRKCITASVFHPTCGLFEPNACRQLGLPDYYWRDSRRALEVFYNIVDRGSVTPVTPPEGAAAGANGGAEAAAASYWSRFGADMKKIYMRWGSVHELSALYDFLSWNRSFVVRETGLWLFDAQRVDMQALNDALFRVLQDFYRENPGYMAAGMRTPKIDPAKLPPIGASPDGIVYLHGETHSLLELKCPCPFKLDRMYVPGKGYIEPDRAYFSYKASVPYEKKAPYGRKARATDDDGDGDGDGGMQPRQPDADRIPKYYILQVQGQMLITGVHTSYFMAWTPTNGFGIYRTRFDPHIAACMLYLFQRFNADYVAKGVEPPVNFFSEPPVVFAIDEKTGAKQPKNRVADKWCAYVHARLVKALNEFNGARVEPLA